MPGSRIIERRCVVTREVGDRDALVRLVRDPEGRVFVDYNHRLPGRGAWVTPRRDCLELLERKPGMLQRPLRGKVDTAGLLERVRAANIRAVEDALTLAARSGVLVGGKDGVRAALSQQEAAALVLASDISPRRGEDLRGRAKDLPCFTLHLDTATLGHRLGKGPRAALAVRRSKISRRLLRELRRQELLR
ncbi:MAG: DUF448 domain-containing protein [Alphaproteobacteria bacterium]|nr:DUF448 domain-containing protein [Alphaproteobacteria bacterium]